ncbi:MAG: hypothetical protein ABIG61_11555, partial [Planctomycetota bacterium]
MLNHPDRKNRINIITLDTVLANDIYERLKYDSRLAGTELVLPPTNSKKITVEGLNEMAWDTVSSRLLIFDVRSQTLTRLQQTYNKIIGYNRCDLNLYCCTIVIGDGPANLFRSGGTAGVFLPLLAKLRT